jgi:hypothetical protein
MNILFNDYIRVRIGVLKGDIERVQKEEFITFSFVFY